MSIELDSLNFKVLGGIIIGPARRGVEQDTCPGLRAFNKTLQLSLYSVKITNIINIMLLHNNGGFLM